MSSRRNRYHSKAFSSDEEDTPKATKRGARKAVVIEDEVTSAKKKAVLKLKKDLWAKGRSSKAITARPLSSSSDEEEEPQGECSICYENYQGPGDRYQKLRRLKISCSCGTAFCYKCLCIYMKKSKVMPSCSRCDAPFDQIFLLRTLPQHYHEHVTRYITRTLLDEEMAHAPERLARVQENGAYFLMPRREGDTPRYTRLLEDLARTEKQVEIIKLTIEQLSPHIGTLVHDLPTDLRRRYFEDNNIIDAKAATAVKDLVKVRRVDLINIQLKLKKLVKKLTNFQGNRPTCYDYKGDVISEEEYRLQHSSNSQKMYRAQMELRGTPQDQSNKGTTAAPPIYPCGRPDCKGMLDSNWICIVCAQPRCRICLAHYSNDPEARKHRCKTSDIATAKLIMEDTKPCPKCATRIQRVYGCDHMFCIECKTGFDYQTGRIIGDGQLHNPHFTEWRQQQRQNATAVGEQAVCPADGAAIVEVDLLLSKCFCLGFNLTDAALIHDFYMLVEPNRDISIFIGVKEADEDAQMEVVSQKYLYNLIEKPDYVDQLYEHYISKEKIRANRAVFQTLRMAGEELITRMMAAGSLREGKAIVRAMLDLRIYINHAFREVNEMLDERVCPHISFRFVPHLSERHASKYKETEAKNSFNLQRYAHIPVFQIGVLGNDINEIEDMEEQYRALVEGLRHNFGLGNFHLGYHFKLDQFNFNYVPLVKAYTKKATTKKIKGAIATASMKR